MNASHRDLPVAVIGAGPVGLAAAAHLVSRGLRPLVLERGASAGAALLEWGHVRVFSPWRYNIDAAARRLLQRTSWREPAAQVLPTGSEIVRHRGLYQDLFKTMIDYLNKGLGPEDAAARNPLKQYDAEFGDPSEFLYGTLRSMMIAYFPD